VSATARIAPLPREEWDEEATAAVRAGFGDGGIARFSGPDAADVPNVLGTLLRHPALAGPFLAYNSVLLSASTLSPRHRELMVLRVAWRTRAPYEWVQHVRLAQMCDVTREEIDAIADDADADALTFTDLERLLLAATDQLLDRSHIDDATWCGLAEHLDEQQLIEALFTVGTYAGLAMVFNGLGLELDAELESVDAPRVPEPPE